MATIFSLIPLDLIRAFEAQVTTAYLARAREMLPNLEEAVSLQLVRAIDNCDVAHTVDNLVHRVQHSGWFTRRERARLPHGSIARHHANVVDALEGGFALDEAAVIASAVAKVEEAVDFFNARVSEKICLVSTSIDGASIRLRLDEVIQGVVEIGDHSWQVSLKTNYRYGENAANGVITVYWQVPCLYRGNDAGVAALRAAELVVRQAADAVKGQRDALKAQRAALETTLYRLGNVRDAHDSLAYRRANVEEKEARGNQPANPDYLPSAERDLAAACAKAGVADPGSLKATRALIKATKGEIQAIKDQIAALKGQVAVA